MPRRKIEFLPGHYYHCYNQGVDKRLLFQEPDNYYFLLRQLKEILRTCQISVIAYCLMPNHYHFLLRQNSQHTPSLLIQQLFNSYTKAYNNRYHRRGTLFPDRFKAKPVHGETHLIQLCWYIHANPVKDGFVDQPEDWPYSNYLEWIGEREGTLVDRAFVQQYYPQPAEYKADVMAYLQRK